MIYDGLKQTADGFPNWGSITPRGVNWPIKSKRPLTHAGAFLISKEMKHFSLFTKTIK